MSSKRAIFFTGGGARGAYQAGVIKAIAEITATHEMPVEILSGVSSGSINAAFIASYSDFQLGVKKLLQVWSQINCGQVFEVGSYSLISSVCRTSVEIVMRNTPQEGHYLLNTHPLRYLIESNINFKTVNENIDKGLLETLIVTALNYETSKTTSFFNTQKEIKSRNKFRYSTQKSLITSDHIMASTAIPLFFPPVKLENIPYGDGALRNNYPLRATIATGANKILIIGSKQENSLKSKQEPLQDGVSFGKILSTVFNSIFIDNIEIDLERLEYINKNISNLSDQERQKIPFRNIEYLYLRPSADLGQIAVEKIRSLPKLLRYLLGGFGSNRQSSDLMSYLMFEAEFCHELINIGYKDTMNRKEEIAQFFS